MADAIFRAVVLTKHKREEQRQLEEGRAVKRSSGKSTTFDDATRLEAEKLAILKQMTKDRELLNKSKAKIAQYREEEASLRAELAKTSAMFLEPGKSTATVMTKDKDGADVKKTVVVKPLGTRDAVSETRRILARRLAKLKQEFQVTEVKFNKQKGANDELREQVNSLRREANTFDGLFDKLCNELLEVKTKTESTQRQIQDAYAARDSTRAEAQSVLDAMQRDRKAAKQEFEQQTLALQEADKALVSKSQPAIGMLTPEEESLLKAKITELAAKVQEHKTRLAKAKAKAATFEDAMEQLRDATAYESLDELVAQMTACEEEKFDKASAVARLIGEVETLEKEIEHLRDEYREKQTKTAERLQSTTEQVASLHHLVSSAHVTIKADKKAVAMAREELANVMPLVSDLFYAAGCHTVFDEAFVPSSSLRQRSFMIPNTGIGSHPSSAKGAFVSTLPAVGLEEEGEDETESSPSSPQPRSSPPAMTTIPGVDVGSGLLEEPRGDHGSDSSSTSSSSELQDNPVGSRASFALSASAGPRRASSFYPGDDKPSRTPSSRRSLAMRMFSRIPAFRHVIDEGVNQHTLHQFMSVLDQKTAELVQHFVYLLHKGQVSVSRSRPVAGRPLPPPPGSPGADEVSPAVVLEEAKQMTVHALVGPSEASGAVARSLTSSALLASMLNTDMGAAASATGEADDARPFSLEEMRQQASATLSSSEFAAYKKASIEAASELARRRSGKSSASLPRS
ncbi:hypothetical protein FNF27_00480 [Cafeteria roenbergensis]|uniref:ODAD1 central coiled coil region domain-containing protein n=1 Tax=Cafeteria roenbergensis TaxID=33653 RepID=A0A5A8EKC7_CAFRO|nr:hypothetical protein FNF29_00213 [Cafeteria roenbergensis]KAA0165519.1 hypothetical protein FNF31_01864 [Cafeteria roenbergensis]KAA0172057.1 hypothetical protein FNF28_00374 [Cafeteria roenbergensis]KAA0177932.1 hypothetical protein FNF27_00480 [Cafeteria roenbergensis]|eukprot:KAA0157637.1 hypothetical protein FNF29_00213 [Cafeteria roenbergensis]